MYLILPVPSPFLLETFKDQLSNAKLTQDIKLKYTMSHSSSRISASSTDFLLLVVSGSSASSAESVSLGLSKTERRGTLSFDLEEIRRKDREK